MNDLIVTMTKSELYAVYCIVESGKKDKNIII